MADKNKDLEWLYRRDDEVEQTAVLNPIEQEALLLPGQGSYNAAQQPIPQDFITPRIVAATRPAAEPYGAPPSPSVPITPGGSEASKGGKRSGKRRRPLRKVFAAGVLAWLLFLVGTPLYAWTAGTAVDVTPNNDALPDQPGTTVLLVGSDAREGLSPQEQARLGTGSTAGRRTDTMLLLHTPAKGKPVLLSLPRDSYLEIPGKGKNKLNAAYAFGGAPLLIETIEQNTGIKIDGYFEIGFLGIVELVDAVGGIEVCPTFDFDDADSHLKMSAGCQNVDGVTALGYVRMRKKDPRGDLGRIERQREVIAALGKKLTSPMTVLNPMQYWKVNMAASKSLTRGKSTDLGQLLDIAPGMLKVVTGSGLSMTVPVASGNTRTAAGSSVIWDKKESKKTFDAIASGDTTSLG